jgi:hypothetical protein
LGCFGEFTLRIYGKRILLDEDYYACGTVCEILVEHINDTTQIERPKRDEYWNRLVSLQIAAPEGREGFDRYFTNTARMFAAPGPGI